MILCVLYPLLLQCVLYHFLLSLLVFAVNSIIITFRDQNRADFVLGENSDPSILLKLFGKTSFAPFHHFRTHGGVGVCPIYSEKARFSRLDSKCLKSIKR